MTGAARLSADQERHLVVAAGSGDLDACRRLVEEFLPAIGSLARRFPHGIGVQRQELLQEGVAGLLFAARRYDPDLGTPFWAYASYWVRKAMQDLVAELTMPVALSDRAVRALAAIRAARNEHLRRHGVDPTTDQLTEATGFTRDQLHRLQAAARTPRSVSGPAARDGEGGAEQLGDGHAELAFEQVLDAIETREVRDLAERLGERERTVIRAHYGLGGPAQTLKQIGQGLGLTAERARQIEAAALGKLREALARPAPPLDSAP
ncbi:sigma-70 family RNA polymerase sigma factor [Pseudonocardia kujensis]|uniref:sigma-70 family RNA polymerase sigma factor n=1 Tax=Pseudonocardia kujensis TaxID=1128675 RepID=UPI001E382085|nr:sigma-70 family RNA polymerase sigma factor [Pseudonocardia kujensis]MCE0766253.1 sigma-70 family RNA polymerase sigma factor [Pseudonocardia kujensis]